MHVSLCLLLMVVANAAASLKQPTINPQQRDGPDDLSAILTSHVSHDETVFTHAISIINNIETAPSCHRIAAKDLLQSCQSLQVEQSNGHAVLDEIKSVYAARLAICELTGAEVAIPPACVPMIPAATAEKSGLACLLSSTPCTNGRPSGFQQVNQKQIRRCLNALEAKPQWWTSYSNARQNAVVMCQASRAELDREHLLDLHRLMTETNGGLSETLARSSQQASKALEQQRTFASHVAKLQAEVTSDLESSRSRFHAFFGGILEQVDNVFQTAASRLTKGTASAADAIGELEDRIVQSRHNVEHVHAGLRDIVTKAQERSVELAGVHERSLDLSQTRSDNIAAAVQELQAQIQSTMHLIAFVNSSQLEMGSSMERWTRTLNVLHNRTETITEMMERHDEALDQSTSRLYKMNEQLDATWTRFESLGLGWLLMLASSSLCLKVLPMLMAVLVVCWCLGRRAALLPAMLIGWFMMGDAVAKVAADVQAIMLEIKLTRPDSLATYSIALTYVAIALPFIILTYGMLRLVRAYRHHKAPCADWSDDETYEKNHLHGHLPTTSTG